MCFSPYLGIRSGGGGGGGVSPRGLVHNLLMQFFTLGCSKNEVFETVLLWRYRDHPKMIVPRYVKHVLGRIYVVSTLFWVCVAWGTFSTRWTCRRQ